MIRQSARRVVAAAVLVLGASAGFVPAAFAADEASGNQSGTMQAIEDVNYTPNATGFNFTPGADMNGQNFGVVNVRSNANGGWTLEVKSLKNSAMEHDTLTGTTIAYSLKVDGTAVTITGADTYAATGKAPTSLTCAATGGCNYNVTADILGTASDNKPAGTYTDTITFRLTNN